MDLCREFGIVDHDYFLKTTSVKTISKWRAYYQVQPFGFYKDEYFNAKICHTIQDSAGKTFKEIPSIGEHMSFTNALQDIAKPGKRIANKVRSVLGRFRGA